MAPCLLGHYWGMEASPPDSAHPRDDQQARLVESLRAAGGEPVEFEELRAKGIEHPAVVSYELEAAGMPIIQTRDQNRRALALDTTLAEREQEDQIAHAEHAGAPHQWPTARQRGAELLLRVQHAAERSWRAAGGIRSGASRAAGGMHDGASWAAGGMRSGAARAAGGMRSVARRVDGGVRGGARLRPGAHVPGRAAAAGALVVSAVVVLVIAAAQFDQSGSPHRAAGHPARPATRPHGASAAQAAQRPAPTVARVPPVAHPSIAVGLPSTPGPASPAAAATFEAEGHQLLSDGRYAAAIGDFLAALRASGQTLGRCTEPTSELCLTFAYALYDLGSALRLEGHPNAAVPILSERLRIDNQRAVVEHELELARGPSA